MWRSWQTQRHFGVRLIERKRAVGPGPWGSCQMEEGLELWGHQRWNSELWVEIRGGVPASAGVQSVDNSWEYWGENGWWRIGVGRGSCVSPRALSSPSSFCLGAPCLDVVSSAVKVQRKKPAQSGLIRGVSLGPHSQPRNINYSSGALGCFPWSTEQRGEEITHRKSCCDQVTRYEIPSGSEAWQWGLVYLITGAITQAWLARYHLRSALGATQIYEMPRSFPVRDPIWIQGLVCWRINCFSWRPPPPRCWGTISMWQSKLYFLHSFRRTLLCLLRHLYKGLDLFNIASFPSTCFGWSERVHLRAVKMAQVTVILQPQ